LCGTEGDAGQKRKGGRRTGTRWATTCSPLHPRLGSTRSAIALSAVHDPGYNDLIRRLDESDHVPRPAARRRSAVNPDIPRPQIRIRGSGGTGSIRLIPARAPGDRFESWPRVEVSRYTHLTYHIDTEYVDFSRPVLAPRREGFGRSCTRAQRTRHKRADYRPHNVTHRHTPVTRKHCSTLPARPGYAFYIMCNASRGRHGLLSPFPPAVALDALTGCPRWSSRPRSRRSRPSRSSPWRRRRG
jgi:hypothetical protein